MKIWVIADTHFNHRKLVEYGRPDDFEEKIIANWNRLVSDEDVVIHLGDVIVGRNSEMPEIISRLKGKKILVKGNHDNKCNWFMKRGFDFACEAFEYKHIYFTHRPSHHLPPKCVMNLHGHTHGTTHRDEEYIKQSYHRELSIEDDLSPIDIERILDESINKSRSWLEVARDKYRRLGLGL